MAHRSLGKLVATASTILLLAASTAALAVLFASPPATDDVEVTGARHARDAREAHARRPTSSSGDARRQFRRDVTSDTAKESTDTTPPTTDPASTSTTENSDSGRNNGGEPAGSGTPGGASTWSTTTCPLPAYPSAACTGVPVGTSLTVHSGNLDIRTANTVIDGRDIRGCVSINAPGVIIRRSRITCTSFLAVASYASAYSGGGVVLEDVEISCGDTMGTGVGDYNFTVRRANIHSCQNGFDIDGQAIVEHSYIHDLIPYDAATDPHPDGAQITDVGNNIAIRHNTIIAGDGNAAIITPRVSQGVISNVLIESNLMAGGTYTLYCQTGGSGKNFRIINNRFSTLQYPKVGQYGPWAECGDETQVAGNVYHETARPVPL
jgi:hypothetical protein